jgi:putative glutathione S-transferase
VGQGAGDHRQQRVPRDRPHARHGVRRDRTADVDFAPDDLREEIDSTIDAIYEPINNGVYRSGFATTQEAYEEAVTDLFDALDHWEGVLETRRYLCGDRITEADWCMFPTLVRFDAVYHGHFKCNLRRIVDYPNLWGYLRDLYGSPASPRPSTWST